MNNYGYIENGVIIKEYSQSAEGMVFKSEDVFKSKQGICGYVYFPDKSDDCPKCHSVENM